jgi:hypothetical protein
MAQERMNNGINSVYLSCFEDSRLRVSTRWVVIDSGQRSQHWRRRSKEENRRHPKGGEYNTAQVPGREREVYIFGWRWVDALRPTPGKHPTGGVREEPVQYYTQHE